MSTVLSRIPVKELSDVLSTRALERIIQDAAEQRRIHPAQLNAEALSEVLKKDVYHRLQQSLPAKMAKQRVLDVLAIVDKTAEEQGDAVYQPADLSGLESGVKKFTLYFDWPESQRLRGVLSIARKEEAVGNDVSALIEEGEGLIDQMERRLAEGLVAQGQELAELKASFERVSGVGGREVRRLDNLIEQLDDAQKQDMLLPGELERARKLSLKLRKKLESSVIKGGAEADGETQAQAAANIRALELEHAARLLGDVMGEFGPLIGTLPEQETRARELESQMAEGTLTEEAITAWQTELGETRTRLQVEQKAELKDLEARLAALPDGEEVSKARVNLGLAAHTLEEGGLVGRELRDLALTIRVLETAPDGSSEAVKQQRELSELERSARNVPGAWQDLRERVEAAREVVAEGGTVNVDELYADLERYMGRAAQERAELDEKADYIIGEYDTVRELAGETTQKLGRFAETLRAQRRLGQLSATARERYVQTLAEAEALLDEARAEYAAAQEVTASFGEDALSSLLDVFNFGDEDNALGGVFDVEESGDGGGELLMEEVGAQATGTQATDTQPSAPETSEAATGQTANTEPATPQPVEQSTADAGGFNPFGFMDSMGGTAAAAAGATAAAVASQPEAEGETMTQAQALAEALPDACWIVQGGQITAGASDTASVRIAEFLQAAEHIGIRRLRFDDQDWTWGAQRQASGEWRLTRASDAASLELGDGGSWLKA